MLPECALTAPVMILCNHCEKWSPPPYRRGRCPRCTGIQVGDLLVCCGDCDRYPCDCPWAAADDADMCLLSQVA